MSKSHNYDHAPFVGATVLCFVGISISSFIDVAYANLIIPSILWVIGYGLFNLNLFKRTVISKEYMNQEVNQRALQLFYENGINQTRDETGILVFISLFERKIEIIADKGINNVVDQSFWDSSVELIRSHIQEGSIVKGVEKAIEHFTTKLEIEFPVKEDDTDEISNLVMTDLKID